MCRVAVDHETLSFQRVIYINYVSKQLITALRALLAILAPHF